MTRYVDTLPPAIDPRDKKVIVLDFGRNGTLGLYHALQILGYKPCHMATVFQGGQHEHKLIKECFWDGHTKGGQPYNKNDLQKWLGQYDAITDITPNFVDEAVAAWPNAKFILTTRVPEAWYRSAERTIFVRRSRLQELMMDTIAFFDPLLWEMSGTKEIGRRLFFGDGAFLDKQAGIATYQAYNAKARTMVPKDRLLEVKLEEGLGWDQICAFLDQLVPDQPYPSVNAQDEFAKLHASVIGPHTRAAVRRTVTAILVPVFAVGAWYYLQHARR